MSAIISKATGLLNSVVSKSAEAVNKTIYWTKVGAELTKTVYQKEGFAPPSIKQFETTYQNLFKFLKSPKEQEKFINEYKNYRPDTKSLVQFGVYGIHLAGFFAVGEIIGRRKFFGYPKFGNSSHH
ncbi:ATP20 [Candida pseudojiufengensis]|uniref:ATP20 n=1 Tax=Candida pseudojiufengensis TaxID=497109 RepID=UPI002224FA46|nr:ATP20 [Candida pseudojiufengensis]KAI5962239.1 ATP20 [Candida pseudojiufengensis]